MAAGMFVEAQERAFEPVDHVLESLRDRLAA